MSMERWNPFRDNFDTMRQAMDRWMDDRWPGNNWSGNMLSVAVDVKETPYGYELEASLPGVRADELDINVERDTVTIRGRNEQQEERREGQNFLYRERRSGSFMRSVRLPEMLDTERAEATLEHGILRLTLPRLSQNQQRRVQVRTGGGMGNTNIDLSNQGATLSGQDMATRTTIDKTQDMASATGPSSFGTQAQTGAVGMTGSQRQENSSARGWQETNQPQTDTTSPMSGSATSGNTMGSTSTTGGSMGSSSMSSSPTMNTGSSGTSSTMSSPNRTSGSQPGMMSGPSGSGGMSGGQSGVMAGQTGGANQSGYRTSSAVDNTREFDNSSAAGGTGTTPNLQSGTAATPTSGWTSTNMPSVGRGAETDLGPGSVGPGASQGEHSQVDHRGQTGGRTYTSGGYRQSPEDTGTSAGSGHRDLETNQGGAGSYGAGNSGDNVSQSQTLGNNE